MKTIQVFDPAMCCESGVCGPSVDPRLARFSADLEWLRGQGFAVERYNLSTQPGMFAGTATVKAALQTDGNDCLPMILCDGEVISKGLYPTRETLAHRVGAAVAPAASCCAPAATAKAAAPAATSCCGPAKPGGSSTGCC